MIEEDIERLGRANGAIGFEGGALGPVGPGPCPSGSLGPPCNPGPEGPRGNPESVPLDEATIGLLADFARQQAKLEGLLEGQRNGALSLYARQKHLEGNWQISPDGRSLVRAPTP